MFSASRNKQATGSLSLDDMKMLNSAIGKLYRHLQLNPKEEGTSSEIITKDAIAQKENIPTLSITHSEESFHEIVLKLRNFEKEFQRQKVLQQRELRRYILHVMPLLKCQTRVVFHKMYEKQLSL